MGLKHRIRAFWGSTVGIVGGLSGGYLRRERARRNPLVLPAYYCGVQNIASGLARLPRSYDVSAVYEPTIGLREAEMLLRRPSRVMSEFSFWETTMALLLVYGNAYYYKTNALNDNLEYELIPLDPRVTRIQVLSNLDYVYRSRMPITGQVITLRPEQVLHIKGLGDNPYLGLNPLHLFALNFDKYQNAEEYGGWFFKNGGFPALIWKRANTNADVDAKGKEELRKAWQDTNSSSRSQNIMIVDEKDSIIPLQLNNKQAQFLETQVHHVRDVARILNCPPSKLKDHERSTYNNISEENISFVRDTLMPWTARIASQIEKQLGICVHFDVTEALSGNRASEITADTELAGFLLNNGANREDVLQMVLDKHGLSEIRIDPKEPTPALLMPPQGDDNGETDNPDTGATEGTDTDTGG